MLCCLPQAGFAIRPIKNKQPCLYWKVFISIVLGGITTLILVTQAVLTLEPWYLPSYVIPLGGMIFANSMNTVSLAAERFEAECEYGKSYDEARRIALHASLIPQINTFFAVGLVALPGMDDPDKSCPVYHHLSPRGIKSW